MSDAARPGDLTEALAEAFYLELGRYGATHPDLYPWSTRPDEVKDGYRDSARALLAGATAPAGDVEPNRCGDDACWPSRPERACIRHVGHQGEHENRDGKTWISPGRALRELDELRRTVDELRAARDEPVETREEWLVRWTWSDGTTEEDRPREDRQMAERQIRIMLRPPTAVASAKVYRRTVTPWVAVPDPTESEEQDRG